MRRVCQRMTTALPRAIVGSFDKIRALCTGISNGLTSVDGVMMMQSGKVCFWNVVPIFPPHSIPPWCVCIVPFTTLPSTNSKSWILVPSFTHNNIFLEFISIIREAGEPSGDHTTYTSCQSHMSMMTNKRRHHLA